MFKLLAVNLAVPALVLIAIGIMTGCFGIKKKESIKGDLFEYFKKDWEEGNVPSSESHDSFFTKFFTLFVQAYEYEKYKENANKSKYYFYKLLVLLILLSIPFLALFLINQKEWILNDSEWNNIYLYAVILVPVIFAYLINQYVRIRQYRETWQRHLRNRHHMEWRMMIFVRDYELMCKGVKPGESEISVQTLKTGFINDICEYWKSETAEIRTGAAANEDNIVEEIGSLFSKN